MRNDRTLSEEFVFRMLLKKGMIRHGPQKQTLILRTEIHPAL
ncbi:MAG TPA: hypothetical protein VLM19_04565 [Nitrospiraceae bacterium]|nr:hypothetical protein [Nitrospiraceae bacterium]